MFFNRPRRFTVETGWVCSVMLTKARGLHPWALVSTIAWQYSMAVSEPYISKSKPNITKSESFKKRFSFL